ncbi:acetylglutamate kinase [Lentilactobacillus raoultii]|uniref:Acetylglutamate kinase n=1 Tax=Lentilactobacillus raoultii TaxID=1987503 RepID=A0ABW3PGH6_9LACO|nr:acetylglutamate kinase [Lentilactobacillus raoultii]
MSQTIVIKIGGHAATELSPAFFSQLHVWHAAGKQILIVHGGGPQISSWSKKLGLTVKKINGIRVTDPETLKVTQAVLLGLVQPMLCQKVTAAGLSALGLNATGQPVIYGDYLNQKLFGEVGQLTKINCDYISAVLKHHIGIVAPLAVDPEGHELNVNGDVAAAGIARRLNADEFILLTDVPGVMVKDHVLSRLSKQKAAKMFERKLITEGMQPKLQAAFDALQNGVKRVTITNELQNAGTKLFNQQLVG